MMTYCCILQTNEGTKAIGFAPDEEKAIGRVMLAITNELIQAVPEDWENDARITFSQMYYAFGDEAAYGFKIEGILWSGEYAAINVKYKSIVGYGLVVGDDEEKTDGER